jgi:hypothetical protein
MTDTLRDVLLRVNQPQADFHRSSASLNSLSLSQREKAAVGVKRPATNQSCISGNLSWMF